MTSARAWYGTRLNCSPSAALPAAVPQRIESPDPSCTTQRTTARLRRANRDPDPVLFDPQRRAVLLVAGDKAGGWTRWYRDAIKLAEDRYTRFLATPPEEIQ